MTRGSFKIDKPGEIDLTLTMTMPLEHWSRVRQALARGSMSGPPGWLIDMIDDVTRRAEQEFDFVAKPEDQP
jgi:hypothetical protein